MATSDVSPGGPQTHAAQSPRERLIRVFEEENARTLRVLRAYPADQAELKPSEKSKTARELAWLFVMEAGLAEKALTTGFDWSAPPPSPPEPPADFGAVVDAVEKAQARIVEILRGMGDDDMTGTVQFFVAPKTLGDVPKPDFLWFLIHDQIHHRGQLSVYLRMAGGKVPSIYGPTADEPWF